MFQNLIAFRKSLGLNQKDFANAIGYKHKTYAAYETGNREPGSDLWITISKKYGVSVDYLLGVTDIPFPAKIDDFDEETRKAIAAFAKISPAAKNRILGLLTVIPPEQQP